MLAPLLNTPDLRLVCHEGEFDQLLAELTLHHLDLVLAGQGAPANDVVLMSWLRLLGRCEDVHEEIHAIRNRRGQQHPLVQNVLSSAQA